jgi:hypothetical protein
VLAQGLRLRPDEYGFSFTEDNLMSSVHTVSQTASLYRPVSSSALQGSLAQYYDRTSNFVGEHFRNLVGLSEQEHRVLQEKASDLSQDKSPLQPKGIGTLIDIRI